MSLEPFCHCEERKWLRGVAEANQAPQSLKKGDKSSLSLEGRGLG